MRRGSSLGVCDGIASYDLTRQTRNNSAVYLPTFFCSKGGRFLSCGLSCRWSDYFRRLLENSEENPRNSEVLKFHDAFGINWGAQKQIGLSQNLKLEIACFAQKRNKNWPPTKKYEIFSFGWLILWFWNKLWQFLFVYQGQFAVLWVGPL